MERNKIILIIVIVFIIILIISGLIVSSVSSDDNSTTTTGGGTTTTVNRTTTLNGTTTVNGSTTAIPVNAPPTASQIEQAALYGGEVPTGGSTYYIPANTSAILTSTSTDPYSFLYGATNQTDIVSLNIWCESEMFVEWYSGIGTQTINGTVCTVKIPISVSGGGMSLSFGTDTNSPISTTSTSTSGATLGYTATDYALWIYAPTTYTNDNWILTFNTTPNS